ncbi:hypothetical protein SPRG_06525 [Saprolegnia parasitica CBS 223.65]|uniref:Uncharacterized protein n=1 Tax=Saprolegnia parasitica (strain CBS 223.65) TaxID=695850 RepID=A0A067CQA3_SAPPC|nr:hypothetical protein SPRG_06525 [Saprolegnia parasitica CBS 223.65]KDO28671.1 hypothetical protein SPRG_06525 [Saprolegnia parasitica CBS 223.65]|eukprot:XP_012200730.1 hypothetical protein SPRG_06525 [Saprolegnia parasitica CBS 223.65]
MDRASTSVLRNPSLLCEIAAYQTGLRWAVARHLRAARPRPTSTVQEQLCLRSSRDPHYAFHQLIADGHLVGVRDLLPYYDSDRAMDVAAIWGQLPVLMYLHLRGHAGCTSRTMDYAAAYGHVACLAFLHAHRGEGCSQQALTYAAAGGHVECVEFLLAHPPTPRWAYLHQAEAMARRNQHWRVVAILQRLSPAPPTKKHWYQVLLSSPS